ncbi:hypothetical protein VTK73DRAFT_8684 [Phialemonium thermophilum]|uniref:SnoaL-like domain-containing protein n=1 Tax=Phialemonium thermophilum TaxID=223376 RepID=A0ABR3W755_9PEZI
MASRNVAEVQKATLDRFIQTWAEWSPDGFMETWTDDCTQQNLPFSMNSDVKTREQVKHFFPVLMSLLTNFKLTVHNVVNDVAGRKAVIYAITEADTPWGPYKNEHAMFLWFTEDGGKVKKIEEMFDRVVMEDLLPKIGQYMAQQHGAGK